MDVTAKLEILIRARVPIIVAQHTMRRLNSGRIVLLSDLVWDKITVALRELRPMMGWVSILGIEHA